MANLISKAESKKLIIELVERNNYFLLNFYFWPTLNVRTSRISDKNRAILAFEKAVNDYAAFDLTLTCVNTKKQSA